MSPLRHGGLCPVFTCAVLCEIIQVFAAPSSTLTLTPGPGSHQDTTHTYLYLEEKQGLHQALNLLYSKQTFQTHIKLRLTSIHNLNAQHEFYVVCTSQVQIVEN